MDINSPTSNTVVPNAAVLISAADAEGSVTYFDGEFSRACGSFPDEMSGQTYSIAIGLGARWASRGRGTWPTRARRKRRYARMVPVSMNLWCQEGASLGREGDCWP